MNLALLNLLLPGLFRQLSTAPSAASSSVNSDALLSLVLKSLTGDTSDRVDLTNIIPAAPATVAEEAPKPSTIGIPKETALDFATTQTKAAAGDNTATATTATTVKKSDTAETAKNTAPLPPGIMKHIGYLRKHMHEKVADSADRKAVLDAISAIESGTRLEPAINPLSDSQKTLLADSITQYGIEPPEILNDYVPKQYKQYTSAETGDCALKSVEVYYSGLDKGLSSTEAYNATDAHTKWKLG